MKYLVSISISLLVFFEISTFCHCCVCCKEGKKQPNELLPKWLIAWSSPNYGLEFSDGFVESDDLSETDQKAQSRAKEAGPIIFMRRVDQHIASAKSGAQLEIARLDAISYEYEGKKMWLMLKNLKFYNLQTYDKTTAKYTQTAKNQRGRYELNAELLEKLRTQQEFKDFIKSEGEGKNKKWYLERKDVAWTINISSKFITIPEPAPVSKLGRFMRGDKSEEEKNSPKPEFPIIVEMDFKIKPQDPSDSKALKKSGSVKIKIYDFFFDLKFVVKHIQDNLRVHLDDKIRANNRVPDFSIKYGMTRMDIDEIKFRTYKDEKDDLATIITNEFEDINPGVNKEKTPPKENNSLKKSSPTVTDCFEDVLLATEVKEHFNTVISRVIGQQMREDITQRMCINLMSKMTWNMVKMDTKLQLPYIVLNALKYEENYDVRAPAPMFRLLTLDVLAIGPAILRDTLLRWGQK